MTMTPAAPEKLPNGAVIAWDRLVEKYCILDGAGVEQGYRRSLEDARAFAAALPDLHLEAPKPAPINISPRAHTEVKQRAGVPMYEEPVLQPDERPRPARPAPEVVHSRDFVRSRMYVPGQR
jgi:hypothetical protein